MCEVEIFWDAICTSNSNIYFIASFVASILLGGLVIYIRRNDGDVLRLLLTVIGFFAFFWVLTQSGILLNDISALSENSPKRHRLAVLTFISILYFTSYMILRLFNAISSEASGDALLVLDFSILAAWTTHAFNLGVSYVGLFYAVPFSFFIAGFFIRSASKMNLGTTLLAFISLFITLSIEQSGNATLWWVPVDTSKNAFLFWRVLLIAFFLSLPLSALMVFVANRRLN